MLARVAERRRGSHATTTPRQPAGTGWVALVPRAAHAAIACVAMDPARAGRPSSGPSTRTSRAAWPRSPSPSTAASSRAPLGTGDVLRFAFGHARADVGVLLVDRDSSRRSWGCSRRWPRAGSSTARSPPGPHDGASRSWRASRPRASRPSRSTSCARSRCCASRRASSVAIQAAVARPRHRRAREVLPRLLERRPGAAPGLGEHRPAHGDRRLHRRLRDGRSSSPPTSR